MVSLLGTSGRMLDTALWRIGGRSMGALLGAVPRRVRPALRNTLRLGLRLPGTYRVGRALGLHGDETGRDDVAEYIRHFGRLDPSAVADVVLAASQHDASDVLPRLTMPALVIAGERDVFAPVGRVSRPIHAGAPGSKLVIMRKGTHGSLFGHAEEIERLVESFLRDVLPDDVPDGDDQRR